MGRLANSSTAMWVGGWGWHTRQGAAATKAARQSLYLVLAWVSMGVPSCDKGCSLSSEGPPHSVPRASGPYVPSKGQWEHLCFPFGAFHRAFSCIFASQQPGVRRGESTSSHFSDTHTDVQTSVGMGFTSGLAVPTHTRLPACHQGTWLCCGDTAAGLLCLK